MMKHKRQEEIEHVPKIIPKITKTYDDYMKIIIEEQKIIEQQVKAEEERLAAEKERLAAEKAEEERLAAEKERLAAEKVEEERLAAEKAENLKQKHFQEIEDLKQKHFQEIEDLKQKHFQESPVKEEKTLQLEGEKLGPKSSAKNAKSWARKYPRWTKAPKVPHYHMFGFPPTAAPLATKTRHFFVQVLNMPTW